MRASASRTVTQLQELAFGMPRRLPKRGRLRGVRSVPTPEDGNDPTLTGKEVSVLLDIAREQMTETLRLAEGFETKARGVMQSATVFFAASWAATAVLLATDKSESVPGWVPIVAAFIGLASLVSIGVAAWKTVALQQPTDTKAVNVDGLKGSLLKYAKRDDPRVSAYMLNEIAGIVRDRRQRNDGIFEGEKLVKRGKAQRLTTITRWAYASVFLSALQLVLSVAVSYFIT